VQAGDNIHTLAKRNEMGPWQIRKYNDLPRDYELTPGEVLYLKPKKRKGTAEYHVVQKGETMWSISQMYGIKLRHLYRKNRLDRHDLEQPEQGQTLYLQKKNPAAPVKSTETKAPDKELKVVLPDNPPKGQDTVISPAEKEILPEKQAGQLVPVLSDTPVLSKEEARDTFNIPREKSDITEKVELHVVQAGETLFSISRKYNLSVEQIRELNNLPDYSLKAGQELILNGNIKEKVTDTEVTDFVHEVKQGETLYSISRKYNMPVEELKTLNQLSGNTVSIGQKLLLSKAAAPRSEEKSANNPPETHVVAAGETLYGIARKYNTSVEELKKINQLTDNTLSIGQELRLK
jgi:membrane-bound lytic murein transglycosylase D